MKNGELLSDAKDANQENAADNLTNEQRDKLAPPPQPQAPSSGTSLPDPRPAQPPQPQAPPDWFDVLLGGLFFLYPLSVIRPQTIHAWWGYLRHLPQVALSIAFRSAPTNCDHGTVPSAELVRRLAEQWLREQSARKADAP